jgi:hypothetical protein
MNYKTLDGKKFVKARATGEFDLEESKQALSLLLQDPGFSKQCDILIDLREAECDLTMADIFEIVQYLVEHRQAFLGKLAVLVSGTSEFDKARFMELCAENRGIKVHAFTDPADAEAWLRMET